MRNIKSLSFILAIVCVMTGPALAFETPGLSGGITMGVQAVDQNDESAQLNPYSDIDDSGLFNVWTDYYKDNYYLNFEGSNISLDDQSYGFEAGQYGTFKFSLHYDEIPHDISLGARTFYSGIGSDTLTYEATDRPKDTDGEYIPNVSTDPSDWTKFDYSEQRKKTQGKLELSLDSNYFVRLDLSEEKKTGVKPYSAASSVYPDIMTIMFSQFGNMVEMPEPVDYTTFNSILDAGYRSDTMVVKLTGMWSEFGNANHQLDWRNPYVTTEELNEESSLPPDNDFYRFGGEMSMQLPNNSVFAMKAGHSVARSTYNLDVTFPVGTDGIGGPLAPFFVPGYTVADNMSPVYIAGYPLVLSDDTFDGKTEHTNGSLSFRSRPTQSLDYKVHYNFLKRDSDSDIITFTPLSSTTVAALSGNPLVELAFPEMVDPVSVQNTLYEYTKHNAGAELGYRLPMASKLNVGYSFTDIDRDELEAAESTTDHEVSLELTNRYFSKVGGRLKYSHLERASDFNLGDIGIDSSDPAYIERFVRYFDSTDMSRDAVKLDVNFNVADSLDINTLYQYENDDYDETRLGKVKEDNHEIYLDVAWMPLSNLCITSYAGYERKEAKTEKRFLDDYADAIYTSVSADPNDGTDIEAIPNPLDQAFGYFFGRTDVYAYNFAYEDKSDFWTFALKANVGIIKDKLDFNVLWSYQENDGKTVFTSEGPDAVESISLSNDYTLNSLDGNFLYTVNKNWSVKLGYIYQQYDYKDVQIDGYQYTGNDSFNRYWLTGAYADNEEENHIVYVAATYQFGDSAR